MAVTGKWEFEVAPDKASLAAAWVHEMEATFREDGGRLYEHIGSAAENGFSFDDSVGGVFLPSTAEIHLFYVEERNISYRAEELAHYIQYKAQGLIGRSEQEIGTVRIDSNEKEMLEIMETHGFIRKR